jgi:hypothetical protein
VITLSKCAVFVEENLETDVKKKVFIENRTSKSPPRKFYKQENSTVITLSKCAVLGENWGWSL